eukprot:TRINITY_DN13349_c0_g1_i1.p1 TRINITY_DN13349_c0_g1~~TRINITY_DN13349_c0_g1_i1.p1  ORF type:complete len:150 (-),score=29.37 TRINITY_DN13349_c0_g1_i1:109-501(-)
MCIRDRYMGAQVDEQAFSLTNLKRGLQNVALATSFSQTIGIQVFYGVFVGFTRDVRQSIFTDASFTRVINNTLVLLENANTVQDKVKAHKRYTGDNLFKTLELAYSDMKGNDYFEAGIKFGKFIKIISET